MNQIVSEAIVIVYYKYVFHGMFYCYDRAKLRKFLAVNVLRKG